MSIAPDDLLITLGFVGVLGGVWALAASPLVLRDYLRWRPAHRTWLAAAIERGLYAKARFTLSRRWKLSGTIQGVPVEAEATTRSTRASAPCSPEVLLRPGGMLEGHGSTGDDPFDKAVALSAPRLLAASLSAPERRVLQTAALMGIRAEGGLVRFHADHRLRGDEDIGTIVDAVMKCARILAARSAEETAERACNVASEDVYARVRCRALLALAKDAPLSPQFEKAALVALTSDDPDLLAIGLSRHGSNEERRDAVGAVAPEVEVVVLESLARDAAGPSTEALLLKRLAVAPDEVKTACASLLGRIGSRDAVQPLLDASPGILGNGTLRRTIQGAIAAIQSRLEGAAPGQLDLADDDARRGALSEAPAAGAVSIAKTPQRAK